MTTLFLFIFQKTFRHTLLMKLLQKYFLEASIENIFSSEEKISSGK